MNATVRRSTRSPQNVEVVFPSKPADDIRAELKAAGFRWSKFSSCWYGFADRLPARYGPPPGGPAEVGGPRDPGEDAADRFNEANPEPWGDR